MRIQICDTITMRKAKGSFRHSQTPDAKRIAHSFFSLPYHLTAAAAGWFFFAQKSGWASAKGQNKPERRKELCTTSFAKWTFLVFITDRTPRRSWHICAASTAMCSALPQKSLSRMTTAIWRSSRRRTASTIFYPTVSATKTGTWPLALCPAR